MWLSLFSVVLAIALGFGLGAVLLESNGKQAPLYRKRSVRHF